MQRTRLAAVVPVLAAAIALSACTSLSVGREASVHRGVSVQLKRGASTVMGREAAWFHSLDDACPGCDEARHPVGEMAITYGKDSVWRGHAASVSLVGGTFSFAETYLQLHDGARSDWGAGIRLGMPGWGANKVFVLADRRVAPHVKLLYNPGLYFMRATLHEGYGDGNHRTSNRMLALTQAFGVSLQSPYVTLTPVVSVAAARGRVQGHPFEANADEAHRFSDTFATAWIGLSFHRRRRPE